MDNDAYIGMLRNIIAEDELFVAENKNVIPMDEESAALLDRVLEAKRNLIEFKQLLKEATL